MSIKKTKFKIELLLLGGCLLLGMQGWSATATKTEFVQEEQSGQYLLNEKDEPGTLLVVEFATGNREILSRELDEIKIPAPVEITIMPSPKPEECMETVLPKQPLDVAALAEQKYVMEHLLDLDYLKEHLYIVNATTKMTETEFDVEYFLKRDMSVEKTKEPQILIYHTHASEGFFDSRAGKAEDTVVGAGALLADVLRRKYGYCVIHDTTVFDKKNGKDNRNYAYHDALEHISAVLEQNPTIEVIIDLHRDAGTKRVVTLDGKQTAKVMLFNGLCRNTNGPLTYLPNDHLKDNLAFSFQMKLIGDELYPGLMNRIFLKDYRYNMHLTERYLLIELGTENNTVEEAMNAMEPLADILEQVLGG